MEDNIILFDDWKTRRSDALKNRKNEYLIALITLIILLFISIFALFFHWGLIIFLIISLIGMVSIHIEWLQVKNNHLIIENNRIMITNRFNKTYSYDINFDDIILKIKLPFNIKSGGIILNFYNKSGKLICKYHDMLNCASSLGDKKTLWEEKILSLGIKVVDEEEIIKNK